MRSYVELLAILAYARKRQHTLCLEIGPYFVHRFAKKCSPIVRFIYPSELEVN